MRMLLGKKKLEDIKLTINVHRSMFEVDKCILKINIHIAPLRKGQSIEGLPLYGHGSKDASRK